MKALGWGVYTWLFSVTMMYLYSGGRAGESWREIILCGWASIFPAVMVASAVKDKEKWK